MKKILFLTALICTATICQAQVSSPEAVALTIASTMKDSLGLTDQQRNNLNSVNLQLHAQKAVVWQRYGNSDSLHLKIQAVENRRDSLYQPLLSAQQYNLYLQKKKTLVNAH